MKNEYDYSRLAQLIMENEADNSAVTIPHQHVIRETPRGRELLRINGDVLIHFCPTVTRLVLDVVDITPRTRELDGWHLDPSDLVEIYDLVRVYRDLTYG